MLGLEVDLENSFPGGTFGSSCRLPRLATSIHPGENDGQVDRSGNEILGPNPSPGDRAIGFIEV